jgi:predicted PurR-regulated permease PerM
MVDAVEGGLGLALLRVPFALPIAILTFFGGFIPILGATVAGSLAVLVAWSAGGTSKALATLALVLAIQQVEGHVLHPFVMGKSVRLHPAVVLIAVAAGALLGGIAGAFAAVPLTAVSTAFLEEVYRRSEPAGGFQEPVELRG